MAAFREVHALQDTTCAAVAKEAVRRSGATSPTLTCHQTISLHLPASTMNSSSSFANQPFRIAPGLAGCLASFPAASDQNTKRSAGKQLPHLAMPVQPPSYHHQLLPPRQDQLPHLMNMQHHPIAKGTIMRARACASWILAVSHR